MQTRPHASTHTHHKSHKYTCSLISLQLTGKRTALSAVRTGHTGAHDSILIAANIIAPPHRRAARYYHFIAAFRLKWYFDCSVHQTVPPANSPENIAARSSRKYIYIYGCSVNSNVFQRTRVPRGRANLARFLFVLEVHPHHVLLSRLSHGIGALRLAKPTLNYDYTTYNIIACVMGMPPCAFAPTGMFLSGLAHNRTRSYRSVSLYIHLYVESHLRGRARSCDTRQLLWFVFCARRWTHAGTHLLMLHRANRA